MSLTPGGRLGPFEITGAIGAGGMGEVYRARDTKLNRDVAIKVLPVAFADDPERLARFTREAQTLASLNHPNIGAIYGIEEAPAAGGSGAASRALVMELVEGDDLSTLIARGPIPVAEALPIARQIAEALDAAHEQGIVHRDLKPANIKVRADGTVKVLDFGLAKAMDPAGASSVSNPNVSHSPTLTHQGTQAGLIIGTAAYMAPEQAKGKAVDKRADIWAFGVVLYEMLTGKRAFKGEDVSDTLASVLKDTLSMDALPTSVPVSIPRLLRRCLEKDPKRRLGSIADARFELDEAASPPDPSPGGGTPSGLARRERALWASVAGIAVIAAVVFALRSPTDQGPAPVMARFPVPPPAGGFTSEPPRMAISPDGRYLVFAATLQPGRPDQLWLRRLDSLEAAPISGTESVMGATTPQNPFWAPDSRRFAYFVQTSDLTRLGSGLRIVDMSGGAIQTTCDFPSNNPGGTWNAEGVILVSTQATKGIQRIPVDGCAATPVTTLDAARNEVAHLFPDFLPDGRHFIYQSQTRSRGDWAIFVGSIDSPGVRKVVQAEYARFAPPNFLLYVKGENLLAQTLDLKTYELTGAAAVLGTGVSSVPTNGRAGFTVSNPGVLVPRSNPEGQQTGGNRQLTWLDRGGKVLGVVGPPVGSYVLRLSPDASKVALLEDLAQKSTSVAVGRSLWVADLGRSVKAPLIPDLATSSPTWSADGLRLRFAVRNEDGFSSIGEREASGAAPASDVYAEKGVGVTPLDASEDGTLLFASVAQGGVRDLRTLGKADGKPITYLADGFDHPQGSFSPNGRFVAFASNESGNYEIIVQPFPDPSRGKWRISANGGLAPRWRRDGRELFYLDPAQRLIAVPVTAGRDFSPGTPTPLFSTGALQSNWAGGAYYYDVAPDGQRFLLSLPAGGGATSASAVRPLTVITNWTSLLTKK